MAETKTGATAPEPQIRDAATVILLREDGAEPRLLMGQRGRAAAFMPSKFVFPGGGVEVGDAAVPTPHPLHPAVRRGLETSAPPGLAHALAMAAIRELWEETGLALAQAAEAPAPDVPAGSWQRFFAAGHRPAADRLRLVFRAITPPGRPRRFDARFFLVGADGLRGDLDDFSGASGELSHLAWVSLAHAQTLDLPFITEVVLSEVAARLAEPTVPRPAPFFHHEAGRSFLSGL
ncbi:MAG: DNA mismatch repair protein MutT [Pikeienuella sp.]